MCLRLSRNDDLCCLCYSWPEKGIDRYSEEQLSIDEPAALQDIFKDRSEISLFIRYINQATFTLNEERKN